MSDASPPTAAPAQRAHRVPPRRVAAGADPARARLRPGDRRRRGLGRFALRVWLGRWPSGSRSSLLVFLRRDWAIALYAHPVTQWSPRSWCSCSAWAGPAVPRRLADLAPAQMGRRGWGMAAAVGRARARRSASARCRPRRCRAARPSCSAPSSAGGQRRRPRRPHQRPAPRHRRRARPPGHPHRHDDGRLGQRDDRPHRAVQPAAQPAVGAVPADSPLRRAVPARLLVRGPELPAQRVSTPRRRSTPSLFPGVKDPGLAATRDVIAETLGLKINYYAMVDMRGFESSSTPSAASRSTSPRPSRSAAARRRWRATSSPARASSSTGSRRCGSPARATGSSATTSGWPARSA
jgi:hypothetical protein